MDLRDYFYLKQDRISEKEVIENITQGVSFKGANVWILITAIFIASLGLNVNSTAVIIGAMLVSPLMGPITGMGLAVGIYDLDLFKRAFKNFLVATIVSVITATLYFLISPYRAAQSELLARTEPTLYDVLIAFMGGAAGIIALCVKDKGNVIPGVAIATALMPPLCTAGFGLATGNLAYFAGAFFLYFINSVFISLATFIGVRVMNFHQKEFVDKTRGQMVRRSIIFVVLATMLPAVYLTYGIIKNTFYEVAANRFVGSELSFENTQVLSKKIDSEKREITVVLIGQEVPEASLSIARDRLDRYNLSNSTLHIRQGTGGGSVDVSSIRALVMEDFYKNSEERIRAKQQQIAGLQAELKPYKTFDELSRAIAPELKVLYPSVVSLSITRSIETRLDSLRTDTVALAVLKFARIPAEGERKKINDWLKARIGTNELRLIIE